MVFSLHRDLRMAILSVCIGERMNTKPAHSFGASCIVTVTMIP